MRYYLIQNPHVSPIIHPLYITPVDSLKEGDIVYIPMRLRGTTKRYATQHIQRQARKRRRM